MHEDADRRSRALLAAAEVFARRGYADTGIPEITHASGMTARELATHFASREALAREIIDVGNTRTMYESWELIAGDQSPFESLIDISLRTAQMIVDDPAVRAMSVLVNDIADGRGLTSNPNEEQIGFTQQMLIRADDNGELLPGADPETIAFAFNAAFDGARRLSALRTDYQDFTERIVQLWQLLLPAITTLPRQQYLRTYLRR